MKLDLYAPKKFFGTHVLAICGWIQLWLYYKIFPPVPDSCGGGAGDYMVFFLCPIMFLLLNIAVLFYAIGWVFKIRVKNQFLLNYVFYDMFVDLGILLWATPLIWLDGVCRPSPRPFVFFIAIFLTIRILKFIQNRIEKKV